MGYPSVKGGNKLADSVE